MLLLGHITRRDDDGVWDRQRCLLQDVVVTHDCVVFDSVRILSSSSIVRLGSDEAQIRVQLVLDHPHTIRDGCLSLRSL